MELYPSIQTGLHNRSFTYQDKKLSDGCNLFQIFLCIAFNKFTQYSVFFIEGTFQPTSRSPMHEQGIEFTTRQTQLPCSNSEYQISFHLSWLGFWWIIGYSIHQPAFIGVKLKFNIRSSPLFVHWLFKTLLSVNAKISLQVLEWMRGNLTKFSESCVHFWEV